MSLSGDPGSYRTSSTSLTTFSSLGFASYSAYFASNTGVRLYSDNGQIDYSTTQGKSATVSSAQTSASTSLSSLSGISGTIAVGMSTTVGGTTASVIDLTYTSGVLTGIKLDQSLTITSGTMLSFSGSGAVGQTIDGAHGSLRLNADGSYTYTPTTDNPYLSSGQSAVEVFDYTIQDSQGVTSSSKLHITVYGTGSNDPVLTNVTGTAYEAGVGRNSSTDALTGDNTVYAGKNATGTVSLGGGTVALYTKVDGTSSTAAGSSLTGAYGSLSIAANGAYTYTVNNSNATVNALLPGSTLTETFMYKVTKTGGEAWPS